MFQSPLALSFITVGVHPEDMYTCMCLTTLAEIYFCSLSQVPCYTPCFQADLTQSLAEAKFYHVEGMITVLERAVYPFKDSVILSSTQGQILMNWLKDTPGFSNCDELVSSF